MTKSIGERIRIYVNEKNKKFNIVDMKNNMDMFINIKDLDTAIEIKTAYCFGYIDGTKEKNDD